MKKLILTALAAMLIGLACWFLFAGRKPPALPVRITLPDGTSVRILATTYGTNHVFGTKLGRFTARLPASFQDILTDILGQRAVPAQTLTTPTPELLVWLDRQTNRSGVAPPGTADFTAFLGDGSNFISGADVFMNGYSPWSQVQPLHFGVFPRRDRKITLNFFYRNSMGVVRPCGSLSFANPRYRDYPQWQPESLPVTRRAGDLEVTLQDVETGHDSNSTTKARKGGGYTVEFGTNRVDGRNATVVDLNLRPLVNTNEVWQAIGVDVSDATGNSAHNSGMSWNGGSSSFAFAPGLWPDEAAWKLKLELKRTEGFRPEELFVFKNVPLGELNRTNVIVWTTNVAGVKVTLQSISRRAPWTNNSWSNSQLSDIHLTYSALAAGTQLDLLRMFCDTGQTNHSDSWSSSSGERDYQFRDIPVAAKTADLTFTVQQSRSVEFTVKPELPKAHTDADK